MSFLSPARKSFYKLGFAKSDGTIFKFGSSAQSPDVRESGFEIGYRNRAQKGKETTDTLEGGRPRYACNPKNLQAYLFQRVFVQNSTLGKKQFKVHFL